ncbi:hypothetical protein Peur_013368 [Populus x canadensis]
MGCGEPDTRIRFGCAQGYYGCYSLADQIVSSCPSGFGIKLTRNWPSPKQWSRRPVFLELQSSSQCPGK